MRVTSPFDYEGELILVEVKLRGPRGAALRRLVLDTGAAATTLLPEVIDELGYTAHDGNRRTRVHSAIGEEHGYSLNVAEFSALGVTTPNFMVNVFDLDHEGFDGLLGMNFLRHFNFEVRPEDRRILVELISGDWSPIGDET
jgi:predicted aspartyl protease